MKSKMRLLLLIGVLALAMSVLGTPSATADSGSASYAYLLGTGLVCGLPVPNACPDIAMAPNGDTVELTGSGTLSIHSKSATGGGTFTHKDPQGNVRGSGTWTTLELLSFHSFGSAAAQGFPPELFGGKALLRVHLTPTAGGAGFDAILRITCLFGNKIPAGDMEGIRLNVPGVVNFNTEVSGLTLFILQ